MVPSLSNLEFQLFQKFITEKCGIDIREDKAYLIETRLSKLLADSGLNSFNALYKRIMSKTDPAIVEKVIDAITTNETFWFRDKTPWLILEGLLLPKYIQLLRSRKRQKIRIWSAAASTGQEAYAIAMCIDNYLEQHNINDLNLSQFEIVATDISKTVLQIAQKGRYDAISIMRGLENSFKEKYFKKEGTVWVIDERIRNTVQFKHFNLQDSFLILGKFDIIFCRYVLIYFADALKRDIFKKLYSSIEESGVMFLGASELYYELDVFFEMSRGCGGTYYVKRR